MARKLGRTADHRRAMLRTLTTQLLEKGKLVTTISRAKELRVTAEKVITSAKGATLHDKRQVFGYVTVEDTAKKTIDRIAPYYKTRQGGYTRITKLGPRKGDAAEIAVIELIEYDNIFVSEDKDVKGKDKKSKDKKVNA
jgi:large subunit ribosomal protein L17